MTADIWTDIGRFVRDRRDGYVGKVISRGNGLFEVATPDGHVRCIAYKHLEPTNTAAQQIRERIAKMSEDEVIELWQKLEAIGSEVES